MANAYTAKVWAPDPDTGVLGWQTISGTVDTSVAYSWDALQTFESGAEIPLTIASDAADDVVPNIGWVKANTASSSYYINVKDYGAVGDGITNDTTSIQNAIAAIPATGGTVFFPKGTYVVDEALTLTVDNTTILGEGWNSIIKFAGGLTVNTDMISSNGINGISILNIALDGNIANNPQATVYTTCVHILNGTGHRIFNVSATGGNIEGIYLYNTTDSFIDNLLANGNGEFRVDASGLHLDTCQDCVVSNVVSNNNGFHGIILSTCSNIQVNNCVLNDNGFNGFMVQTGCSYINGSNIEVNNNFRGLYLRDYSDLCTFSNVTGIGNDTSGVVLDQATAISISGITSRNNDEYGIRMLSPDDELTVSGFKYRDNVLGIVDFADGSKFINLDKPINEPLSSPAFATNAVTVNLNSGNVASPTGTLTANFAVDITNAVTTDNLATTVTIFVTQGATGYVPDTLSVNGSAVTFKWQGGSAPTPTSTAGKIDIFSFTLLRVAGAWTAFASSVLDF